MFNAIETFGSQGFAFSLLETFVVIALVMYLIFAFVIVKQVQKMTETLEVGFETPLRFIAMLHFLLAIGVFLIALVIL